MSNQGGNMATTLNPQTDYMIRTREKSKANLWAVPIGRFLYSLIFVFSGINHFSSGTVSYAANSGVPFADILVPVSGVIAIVGGLSVMTGYHARFGALLLFLFLVPVTLIMHDFWNIQDAQMAQQQMSAFMKNISMIGGAILLMFYGAGPVSIDHHHQRKSSRRRSKRTRVE